jgi:hypothetical protein
MKLRIVLSYGEDERLPVLISLGHNLKEKNVLVCEYKKIIKEGEYSVIFIESEKKDVKIMITSLNGGFARGFLYTNEKEFPVVDYKIYSSLQIEDLCYDNIAAVRLPDDYPF